MLFLHSLMNEVWSINRDFAANFLPLIASYIKSEDKLSFDSARYTKDGDKITERNGVKTYSLKNGVYVLSEFGEYVSPEDAPEDSIAIVNINGAITKYDQACGPAGMKTKSELILRCANNSRIKGVGVVMDSGGGQSKAMFAVDDAIQEARKLKGVGCFIDDNAYSAAAGIASSCDFIIANNVNANIGSYGTYATIVDYSEYYKKLGINIIEVYATLSNDKNQPFIQAINGDDTLLKAIIDKLNESFLSMVETNRGSSLKANRTEWGTGKEFYANEALEMGLIDDIGNFAYFIDSFNK
jgi:ClpP class serine protease